MTWKPGQKVRRVRGEERTIATVIAVTDQGNALVLGAWFDVEGKQIRGPNYIEEIDDVQAG